MPPRTASDAAAAPPAPPPERKSQMPAATGKRSRRGTAGVAAGGSGEERSLGPTGCAEPTRPRAPAAVGKGKDAGERTDMEVDDILEGSE
ncbi:Os01g0343780, partial [Oryza sativa Japonica Group]